MPRYCPNCAFQTPELLDNVDPVTIARGLVLTTHGFVLSSHTMVDDSVSEAALDAELTAVLTRALRP